MLAVVYVYMLFSFLRIRISLIGRRLIVLFVSVPIKLIYYIMRRRFCQDHLHGFKNKLCLKMQKMICADGAYHM